MRQEYDAFKALQRIDDDLTNPLNVTVNVSSKYTIGDFNPGISARISNFSEARVTPAPPPDPLPVNFDGNSIANSLIDPLVPAPFALPMTGGLTIETPVLAPPSSVALAIIQKIALNDSDLLITATPDPGFVSVGYYQQSLTVLTQYSETLSIDWPATLPETGADIAPLGVSYYETAQIFEPDPVDGAVIHLLTGADAAGVHVDGQTVETMPDLDEFMPPFLDRESQDDDDIPHEVIAGGNMSANVVSLAINWIDAPVMAIMGDSHSFNAISQVNVLSNLDCTNGLPPTQGAGDTTHNIAAILSRAIPESTPPEGQAEDAEDEPDFPDSAIVARLTDDLVNFNWVEQYNYLVDNDVLSVKFSGNESFLQTGGNTTTNYTTLQELGFHYDLIVVSGSLINISVIDQVNVLLDNDSISYGDGWEASGGDNLLWNEAVIETIGADAYGEMSLEYEALGESLAAGSDSVGGSILDNPAFEGLDTLKVLYIEGDLINFQYISQTNIVGDADQLQLHAGQMASQEGAEASLIVGENALLNLASIYEAGLNSEIHLGGDQYSDALMYQAGLIVTDESQLVTDNGNGLASEAVAFLTDDTGDATNQQQDDSTHNVIHDDMGADPMAGVLV
ncbi:hypothetical protein FDP25_01430 [Roseovarius sp. A21]|uniref:Uncharacterized protein n=1 Tax=Roseovarius bejariae TaxID=2576383 RepID=A0A844CWT6_9RHOB|nr:hypothetical protein [Roseovarius bejariae]MRU14083.1 hypothetical protein [Roseovarius bejariae]